MSFFQRARFVAGAVDLAQLPGSSLAEVAFAGRSNAGKSSAINTLLNRKRLAFVSRTPGRTQQLNFFDLGAHRYLVDLPGYGYAKISHAERDRWGHVLPAYLQHRQPLRGLVVIMDIRQPLTELDELLFATFAPTGKPVHALLTKTDKLSGAAAQAALIKVRSQLKARGTGASCQLFSSLTGEGLAEAQAVVAVWLGEKPAAEWRNKKPPVKGE